MKEYLFFRQEGFYTLSLKDDEDAIKNALCNEGTERVQDFKGNVIWRKPIDLQKFIQDNIPNSDTREDVKQYLSLKGCLADKSKYDRSQAADYFEEFLTLKDSLFNEAMSNFIKKRENGED